jgi:hypothetical protein
VTGRPVERACYAIGAVLVLSGLVHLGVLLATGGSWAGPVSWRKPTTFGLSFGLTLMTIAWVASYLRLSRRSRRWLLGLFAGACVVEVALITVQAWRRVPSHFNMETPFDATVARVLAGGGGVLVVVIALLTVASWRSAPDVTPSVRLAVRAGFLALDAALAVGVVMIVAGVTDVARGAQQSAYGVGTQWKPAHAVTMHGVLVLPAMAWLLARSGRSERYRVRVVGLAVAGYALLCGVVVAESVAGIDPLQAPVALTAVAGIGALIIAAAGVLVLEATGIFGRRRRPRSLSWPPMPENDLVVRVVTAIAAAPDRVWEILADLPGYRVWHPNTELLGGPDGVDQSVTAGSVLRLRTNAGTPAELEFEVTVTEVAAPSVLAWEGGVRDVFYGRHRFTLIPQDGGTRLVNEETFSGSMAVETLARNRAAVEAQYAAGDAALKAVAEGATRESVG